MPPTTRKTAPAQPAPVDADHPATRQAVALERIATALEHAAPSLPAAAPHPAELAALRRIERSLTDDTDTETRVSGLDLELVVQLARRAAR